MKCRYLLVIPYFYLIGCFKHYDVESGEISSPFFSTSNSENAYCSYKIKVPKGRRITVEIKEGKSLIRTCEENALSVDMINGSLEVNINNYLILIILIF